VGNLDRRIEALERLYAMSGSTEREKEGRTEQRADLLAKLQDAKERAVSEALERGDSRRLHALEDLERHMRERTERGVSMNLKGCLEKLERREDG
jgi:hypothetical protein